jgi:cytochrome c peroxidase
MVSLLSRLKRAASLGALAAVATSAGCSDAPFVPVDSTPALDAQLRQAIAPWGVVPILPVNAPDPALVSLGKMLFFDKVLSGNRDVACASCHSPAAHTGDDASLAIGTGATTAGGVRALGAGREFTPRNAPSLFSVGLRPFYLFWDGRVNEELGPGRFNTPLGNALPTGVNSLLAAQAMIPVTNRVEMRGNAGDHDVFGNVNEIAQFGDAQVAEIWSAVMHRLLAIPAYQQMFAAAYPSTSPDRLGFEYAANAIAAFETQNFTRTNSAFDRYLAHEDNALSLDAKRGALLFFTTARCSSCHNGPLLGAQSFASIAVPQLGPGSGNAAPLDVGRGDETLSGQGRFPRFFFRVAPLRNVELTAPYMHNGAYPTLEAVVRHYNNVDSAVKSYDVNQLPPSLRSTYHGDAATISTVIASLDPRLVQPLRLTAEQQRQIVAFLKSLTDPSARDLSGIAPNAVPSGLAIP